MYYTADGQILSTSSPVETYPQTPINATTVYGTDRNDSFSSKHGETMAGGLGDDVYNLWQVGAQVVEGADGGIDTIFGRYSSGVVLPDNVENLFLVSNGATYGTGNALNNIIASGNRGAILDGMAGNDVLVGGAGDDVFIVSSGNGSDAIMNFTSGHDTILLRGYGYGISSWSDISQNLHQSGDDVTLDLPGGEQLVIRDMLVGDLSATDFDMALPTHADPGSVSLENAWDCKAANGWYVLNNAWGASDLVEGKDYVLTSTADPTDMTSGTTFNWAFPTYLGDGKHVLAYPEVIFGVSPHGDDPGNRVGVFPIQVADIGGFKADYDVDFTGSNGFNVSFDIWLTNQAYGDASTISNEVMIWVRSGDMSAYGDLVGTYSKDGFDAHIYHKGTYTAVVADADVPAASIDVADILATLADMGIVSQDEYVASVEFGAEVTGGAGSLTINNLDLSVDQIADDGGMISYQVTGAGTDKVYSVPTSGEHAATAPAAVMQPVHDSDGNVIAYTRVADHGSQGVLTTHYDLADQVTGSNLVQQDAGGAVRTTHYDATGATTGSELAITQDGGAERIYYYDMDGSFTGSKLFSTDPGGGGRVVSYDVSGAFIGADVTTISDGITRLTHYDADWKVDERTFTGTDAADKLYGGNTANTLIGGAGDDKLVGGAADDRLVGGSGKDVMRGQGGADHFVFESVADTGNTRATADVILDFSAAQGDRIDLSAIDANTNIDGHQSFTFVDHQPAAPSAGTLWTEAGTDAGTWNLKGDIDGDGKADFSIEVHANSAADINADTILGAEVNKPAGPYDITTVISDTSTRTSHYDANGVLQGSEVADVHGDVTRTYFYDAKDMLLGSQRQDVDAAGAHRTSHYDVDGKHLGTDAINTRADGITVNVHYDADWKADARTVTGTDGNDFFFGGTGSNTIYGGAGNDRLGGNTGDDTLVGGAGKDTMKGFAGADTFVFEKASDTGNSKATADWIQDFNQHDGDRIDLSGVDANSLVDGHQSFTFTDHQPDAPTAGSLWLEGSGHNWQLMGDTNGDGIVDFMVQVDTVHTNGISGGDLIL